MPLMKSKDRSTKIQCRKHTIQKAQHSRIKTLEVVILPDRLYSGFL